MNRLFRPTVVAALAAGFAVSLIPFAAHANVEVGGTAGIHVFSDENELGVSDVPDASSERNSALFGLRLGVFFGDMIGVEGEIGVIPSESRDEVFDIWNLTYRAHLVAQFRAADPAVKLVPFVLAGAGAVQVVDTKGPDVISEDTDPAFYVGVGAKYRVDNGWGLRADGRILMVPSSEDDGITQDFELLLSIYKEFGRKTVDKAIVAPPPDDDPDRDGIRGDADKCPTEPEDKDSFEDDNGCPDPDNDGDGIADAADKCPLEAEDKDSFQDEDGCPDPDNDGDGVPDAADKCPTEPETKNGFQDDDGCPDEIPEKLKQFTGVIQGITFKVGSAELAAASSKVLDKAVEVLAEFKDIKLEVQGHTDDQPIKSKTFADNHALSHARAESVKAYFVKKGIEEGRLIAKGYGDSVPVEAPAGLKGGKLNSARQEPPRRVQADHVGRGRGSGPRPRPRARARSEGVAQPNVMPCASGRAFE